MQFALSYIAQREPIVVPTVLSRWAVVEDRGVPTMATNGRVLRFNPEWVAKRSVEAVCCVVLHEAAHVLNTHQHRRGARNHKGFNIAADLSINSQLFRGYQEIFHGDSVRLNDEVIKIGCFVGFGSFGDLPAFQTAEKYYDLLKAQVEKAKQEAEKARQDNQQGEDKDTETRPGKGSKEKDDSGSEDYEEGEDDGQGDDGLSDPCGEDEDEDDAAENPKGGKGEDEDEDGEAGEGMSAQDFEDEATDKGSGAGEGGDGEGDGEEQATSIGAGADGDPSGGGKPEDPFAGLPDLSETFGGELEDAPIESELREDEAKILLEALLGGDGYSPLGLGKIISQYQQQLEGNPEEAAAVNWRRELEKFLRTQHAAGWKYVRPSRRHGHRTDIILPARRGRCKTKGLFITDTSGSMGDEDCNKAMLHLGKVLAMFPQSTVTMLQCDTAVRCSREYRSSDFPINEFEGWKGRGGTTMDPAFLWAKERKTKYDWVVMVTDMGWSYWAATNPGIPVLWLNTCTSIYGWESYAGGKVPFGKLINLHADVILH